MNLEVYLTQKMASDVRGYKPYIYTPSVPTENIFLTWLLSFVYALPLLFVINHDAMSYYSSVI